MLCDAASATQKRSDAKYNSAESSRAVHETNRKSEDTLRFALSQAFKNRLF